MQIQLSDTVVIKVSLVKALRLRGIIYGDYIGPNICHHEIGDTGFYGGQTSYLSMKVLKDEKIN